MSDTKTFKALWVEENSEGQFTRRVAERSIDDLPPGDALVRVAYSSLNYKDALSATGARGVTRKYPHTPGIDAAGVVESSTSAQFQPGEMVLCAATGDLGVNTSGGFGGFIRVPAEWLIRLPEGLSAREAMGIGTAGFTAALCVERLVREGVAAGQGEVVVTGATGGVGCLAVALLAQEGFQVTAVTGKLAERGRLEALGAQQVMGREELDERSGRPLLHSRWAGAVDTVGGNILATVIRSMRPGGVVTSCGNAASAELPLTVYPFILRGVTLAGIDATQTAYEERVRLWQKLAKEWKPAELDGWMREAPLNELDGEIDRILQGGQVGRVVVRLP